MLLEKVKKENIELSIEDILGKKNFTRIKKIDNDLKSEIELLLNDCDSILIYGVRFRNSIKKIAEKLNIELNKDCQVTIFKDQFKDVMDYIYHLIAYMIEKNCEIREYQNLYLFELNIMGKRQNFRHYIILNKKAIK